ncbi:MAG: ABC transporter permease [Acidimicrobiales bacterium]
MRDAAAALPAPAWAGRMIGVSRVAGVVGASLVTLVLLGPLVVLASKLSPGGVWAALSAPGALGPLAISLGSAAIAVAAVLLLGTPLAWAMAKGRLPGQRVFEVAVLLPLMMPPLVIGLLLVFMVGGLSPIGQALARAHLSAGNTFLALVIAEFYECAPYYVLGAEAAFASVEPGVEDAAALLGERPFGVARRVSLPLAAPGLASALSMAWARAIGAFGAVIIIAYHPYGLPMQIWTTLEETGLPAALPFAFMLLLVALPLPVASYVLGSRAARRL